MPIFSIIYVNVIQFHWRMEPSLSEILRLWAAPWS